MNKKVCWLMSLYTFPSHKTGAICVDAGCCRPTGRLQLRRRGRSAGLVPARAFWMSSDPELGETEPGVRPGGANLACAAPSVSTGRDGDA